MTKRISPQRARERTLFLYRNALERGDFETVASVLRQAERDPILVRMISELHELDEAPPEREPVNPTALKPQLNIQTSLDALLPKSLLNDIVTSFEAIFTLDGSVVLRDSNDQLCYGPDLPADERTADAPIFVSGQEVGRVGLYGVAADPPLPEAIRHLALSLSHIATQAWRERPLSSEVLQRYVDGWPRPTDATDLLENPDFEEGTPKWGTAQAVLETALQMLQGEMGVIFQYVDNQVSFVTALPADTSAAVEAHMALFTAVAYQAAQAGEVQVMTDVKDRTELPADVMPCASMIAVPLKRGNRVRDVLCVAFRERRDFQERELNSIDLLANQAAGHLENATLHEQVRAGNNRMRAILDSTRDGVILLDANERLIEANASAEHLLGIGLTDYIGEHFVTMLLRYTEPDAAGKSRDDIVHMARLLRLEPERITRRQFERKTPTEHLYIEEVGSPVRDINNQIHGRLLVLRDITEEKLLEAYRGEITNMAIHDLRGPLASIINGLALVLQDLQEGDQQASAETTLGLLLESAEGLMALVDSMMDIAKLETRQMLLQRGAISLPQLVENAFMALVSSIQAAGVKPLFDLPTDLPLIYVDGDIIRRVLINLLDNAVRHSPNGGDILIEATHLAEEQRILLRIADSGPGIPPGERERIFEKFTQLQGDAPRRGRRGTGLGLTFCKLAVEAQGERIWVEPKSPLAGACFALTLPIAAQRALSTQVGR